MEYTNCLNGKFDKILRRGGRLARGEVTSHPKISEKTDTEFKEGEDNLKKSAEGTECWRKEEFKTKNHPYKHGNSKNHLRPKVES